jgi:hypothetical protein
LRSRPEAAIAILGYRLRANWLGVALVALIFAAGRPAAFAACLHLPMTAPVLTSALLAVVMMAAHHHRDAATMTESVVSPAG